MDCYPFVGNLARGVKSNISTLKLRLAWPFPRLLFTAQISAVLQFAIEGRQSIPYPAVHNVCLNQHLDNRFEQWGLIRHFPVPTVNQWQYMAPSIPKPNNWLHLLLQSNSCKEKKQNISLSGLEKRVVVCCGSVHFLKRNGPATTAIFCRHANNLFSYISRKVLPLRGHISFAWR